jgi:MFS family permease
MRRSLRALDLVNLLQADVGAGLGPFLAIYLMASRGWKPGMIGVALAAQGYATVAAQTPAGALIDWIHRKRLAINESDIDHALAREALPQEHGRRAAAIPLRQILSDYRIGIFAACAILFHFANAAMLPLLGQRLSAGHARQSTLYMSACIMTAQLVMVVVAPLAGRFAARWGRKPVLLIGFAALPIRGVLYTLTNSPYPLISVQVLDGVGAGIWGVVWVIIAADLARGTGRFNLIQGLIATGVAIGASSSNLATGFIAQHFGYDAGFLVLAAIAGGGFATLLLAMPETIGAASGVKLEPASAAIPD